MSSTTRPPYDQAARHPDDVEGYWDKAYILVTGFGDLEGARALLEHGMKLPLTPGRVSCGGPIGSAAMERSFVVTGLWTWHVPRDAHHFTQGRSD